MHINDAASLLEVSPATLRNWVKSGLVPACKSSRGLCFLEADVTTLKGKISLGEVRRLRKRANKNQNTQTHSHSELLENKGNELPLLGLISRLSFDSFEPKDLLLALYFRHLEALNLISFRGSKLKVQAAHLHDEIRDWGVDIQCETFGKTYAWVGSAELDFSDNTLGFVYQTLSLVGDKQKGGAYYTPPSLIRKMATETVTSVGTFFDPCCGSGSFLIEAFVRLQAIGGESPHEMIFGADLDMNAVLVARANLTLVSAGKSNSVKQIVCCDSLQDPQFSGGFRFICTNPPWGGNFAPDYETCLKQQYAEIKSGESFSYFIAKSLEMLAPEGVLSFVLPESFLNVKLHSDIRRFVLKNYDLKAVKAVSEKFSGVFTKAITITVSNTAPQAESLVLIENKSLLRKPVSELIADEESCIPFGLDEVGDRLLKHMEAQAAFFLKGNADWALGIVTGDNERFLSDAPKNRFECILKGTDVFRFRLSTPGTHLLFKKDELQQVAPEDKYRVAEKLVYRFICKELVFAIDRGQRLTLNSANVLLPRLPGYSLRAICGILNSQLGQFYYQNKFNSIKTLRGNLEKFPFPAPQQPIMDQIEEIVRQLESGFSSDVFGELNSAVLELYQVPAKARVPVVSLGLSETFN
ncbi:N-6 DNA methylase [Bdellovibrionota bacterium FG-2]